MKRNHVCICAAAWFLFVKYVRGVSFETNETHRFNPSWDSLDKRPLPSWYDEEKFGILLHWGVYSVPGFRDERIWKRWKDGEKEVKTFMEKNYPPDFEYVEFADDFKAELFNATFWANTFYNAGAKYILLTSKHHDGYALWPSTANPDWNSEVTGPRRDLVDELSKAVRRTGMHFGLYYSLIEWFNPLYINDSSSHFTTQEYVNRQMLPDLRELVNKYTPDIIWTDGDWAASDKYFKAKEFLAWLYNESPVKDTVVVNDRWGKNMRWKHGGFYTCSDRYNPRKLKNHKWENCLGIDKRSLGFRYDDDITHYMTSKMLIEQMVSTVSCGGNILMNIGPNKHGVITTLFLERLHDVGTWLQENGDAIYNTSPWVHQRDQENKHVWYTQSNIFVGTLYAVALQWPHNGVLSLNGLLKIVSSISDVKMLGYEQQLTWNATAVEVRIHLPSRKNIMNKLAWTVEIKTTPSDAINNIRIEE